MNREIDYSIWQEFSWIPTPLLEQWFHLVNDSTKPAKWEVMHRTLRRDNAISLFHVHEGTLKALHYALEGWRDGTSQYHCAHLIAVLMALECLSSNYLGWAEHTEGAKERADKLITQYFGEERPNLLAFFFPLNVRAYLNNELQRSFGPKN